MTNLFERDTEAYKPTSYPEAYNFWLEQQRVHWLTEEVPMDKDLQDWVRILTDEERNFLTQIFRFFTQGDVDVASAYLDKYIPTFGKHPEIKMMMTAFANMETVHIDAYSKLIETVGMADTEYEAFLDYEEMAAKHNYLNSVEINSGVGMLYEQDKTDPDNLIITDKSLRDAAKALAIYSGFTEGLQLFSSFAMLLNFARFGKMKGMGQIVTWSIRDETLHVEGMTWLFRQLITENPHIWTDDFKHEIYQACRDMVELEDGFIDLAFELGGIEGLSPAETKEFVRYIADRRLLQLGLKPNYGIKENPLPWYNDMLNSVEHANFFETRATEYSKGTMTGSWD